MKKIYTLFILTFTMLPALSFSQTKNAPKSDKETIALLCHKWQLTHMGTHGKVQAVPPGMTSYLSIKSDGTIVETDQGTTYPGRWTYSHGTLSVTNDGKGPVEKYRVVKITDAELVYETNEDGTTTTMRMKRVD